MKTFTTPRNRITVPDKAPAGTGWWEVDYYMVKDRGYGTAALYLAQFVDTVAEHVDAVATSTGRSAGAVIEQVCRDLADTENVQYTGSRWRLPPCVKAAIVAWYEAKP